MAWICHGKQQSSFSTQSYLLGVIFQKEPCVLRCFSQLMLDFDVAAVDLWEDVLTSMMQLGMVRSLFIMHLKVFFGPLAAKAFARSLQWCAAGMKRGVFDLIADPAEAQAQRTNAVPSSLSTRFFDGCYRRSPNTKEATMCFVKTFLFQMCKIIKLLDIYFLPEVCTAHPETHARFEELDYE
ncbi:unnamed protein product [Peronospora belbahrii]|uniref:Uncharacterized protein n=1 Tax=Peronospora belbahrii TaxID=622444 RepID=A0ABN8CP71_9STRA|nr:unnamed protein product [Peronospora belbahrii]